MPLIGGGGSGNVAGGNPSGVGGVLNFVGDHCYLYTGQIVSNTTAVTVSDITTGSNSYIVGKVTLNAGIPSSANIGDVDQVAAYVYFNGIIVASISTGNASIDSVMAISNDLIIPPETKLRIDMIADQIDSNNFATLLFTGRVYG
jgi:hypothetical protein